MHCSDLSRIKIRRFEITEPRSVTGVKFVAWDTETSKDGYARLVTWCDEKGCDYRYITTVNDLFSLFNKMQQYDHHVNYWWNLNFDFAALMKWLTPGHPHLLMDLTELGAVFFKNGNDKYMVKWIPKKFWSIKKNKKNMIRHFDLYQFFDMSLKEAAIQYSELRKSEFDVKNMSPQKVYTDKELLKYALQDVRVTYDIARYFHVQLERLQLNTKKPFSKATLGQLMLRKALAGRNLSLPAPIMDLSWKSYYGGRFETIQRGTFTGAIELDINSAYPSKIKELPDIWQGRWCRTNVKKDIIDAEISFAKVRIDCKDNAFSPVNFRTKSNLIVYPKFHGETYLSGSEIDLLSEWPNTSYTIEQGLIFRPKTEERPFAFIDAMYHERQRLKAQGDKLEQLLKISMNSIYGKLLQKIPEHKLIPLDELEKGKWPSGHIIFRENEAFLSTVSSFKAGSFFCPPYAATITGRTRAQLMRLVLDQPDNIIALATDAAFLYDKVNVKTSKDLGAWDVKGSGNLTMVANGMYVFGQEKKCRGFEKFFALDKMLEKAFGLKTRFEIPMQRVTTIKDCYRQHKEPELNQFVTVNKYLDLNCDEKRNWPTRTSAKKLLEHQESSITLPHNHHLLA